MRWWYDGSRVTSYGEGLARASWNPCWGLVDLSAWWRFDYWPSWIGISGKGSFVSADPCPGLFFGWLKTTTWGSAGGGWTVWCEHSDLKFFPPPTKIKCWAEVLQ